MFSILGTAVELLYGNNLGFEGAKPVFTLMSDVLRVEQQLHDWRCALPMWLQPVSFKGVYPIPAGLGDLEKRLQTITIVRYHYMRSLIHRPVLVRLLGHPTEDIVRDTHQHQLRDVGQRSLETCVESSINLISCVHTVCRARAQKSLLGTWWCSLYFSKT